MQEREIFLAACEIANLDDRNAFIENACSGHAILRTRLHSLLIAHASAEDFLETPAVDQITMEAPDSTVSLLKSVVVTGGESLHSQASIKTQGNGDDQGEEITLAFLQPSKNPDSLGRLGNYEILQVLGRGTFGIVLKAFDEQLHRVDAIKVMSPEFAATSPARKRFLREARASAAVRHENVVHVNAVSEQPIPHLIMEYVPGQTIQQRIDESGPLEVVEVLRIGRQIASGLAAAHAIGLIHRDIKPSNILLELGHENRVKITDFGLARAADDASVTQSGIIAGTPMYMSPEQALGAQIDQRADLFSLGSVLYVMVSGRPPFRAPNAVAVLKRVADDNPRPIQQIVSTVPPWLCKIISKLHAKSPDDRFGSATEVADLLSRCLADVQQNIVPTVPGYMPCETRFLSRFCKRFGAIGITVSTLIFVALLLRWNIPYENSLPAARTEPGHQATKKQFPLEVPIDLGPLLGPSCMGSGRYSDVVFDDTILTLDGTTGGQNLWINFENVYGEELTIQTQLRVLNPEAEGYAKLIFLPQYLSETYAMIGNKKGQFFAWIDMDRTDKDRIEIPTIKADDWMDLKFVVTNDKYSFYLDDKLAVQLPRESRNSGFVSICCGVWRCEMKHPQVILHKSLLPEPSTQN